MFIKDMPGHFMDTTTDLSYFPEDCLHTFLIRHPAKSMMSELSLATKNIDYLFMGLFHLVFIEIIMLKYIYNGAHQFFFLIEQHFEFQLV